nr:MAG TPA: hypothetical protein [Caudoviricetes sp.]
MRDYSRLHKTGKKRGYKKSRSPRAKTSYESYLQNIQKWRAKGYATEEPMDAETYYEYAQKAKAAGIKNIARELAKHERIISYNTASLLREQVGGAFSLKEVKAGLNIAPARIQHVQELFDISTEIEEPFDLSLAKSPRQKLFYIYMNTGGDRETWAASY